jgi:hypothetical protein
LVIGTTTKQENKPQTPEVKKTKKAFADLEIEDIE